MYPSYIIGYPHLYDIVYACFLLLALYVFFSLPLPSLTILSPSLPEERQKQNRASIPAEKLRPRGSPPSNFDPSPPPHTPRPLSSSFPSFLSHLHVIHLLAFMIGPLCVPSSMSKQLWFIGCGREYIVTMTTLILEQPTLANEMTRDIVYISVSCRHEGVD